MGVNTALDQHAQDIVERLAISRSEQGDMKAEFISHLQASKADYEQEGYSEKEAEKRAVSHFGQPKNIADDLHDAIFPYRKILFLIMAILSFVTAFGNYLAALFTEGDAHYGALVTSVLSSTAFLVLSLGKYPKWEKKPYLIILLVLHGLFFIYQALIATSIVHAIHIPLSILACTIILFTIVLIYQVAMAGAQHVPELKWLHGINITIGLGVISYGLFMLWASIAFGGGVGMVTLIGGIPFFIWLIAYVMQVQLVKHDKTKAANVVLILQFLFALFAAYKYVFGLMLV